MRSAFASSFARIRAGRLFKSESNEPFSAELTAKVGNVLIVVSGVITLTSIFLPRPPGMHAEGVAAIGVIAIVLGAISFTLPWGRWPRAATMVMVPIACTLIAFHNYFAGADAYRYSIFFVVSYAWLGFAHRPGSSIKIAWTLPIAYLTPIWATGQGTPSAYASLIYVLPLCICVSESISWIVGRVVRAETELERRRGDEALLRAELKYQTLIEQIPAVTYVARRQSTNIDDWKFEYISPQLESMMGEKPAEWIADPTIWASRVHPDDRATTLALDDAADVSGDPFNCEYRFVKRDGSVLWLQEYSRLIPGSTPENSSWQGAFFDITAIKEAVAATREANELHQSLVERLPGIVYLEALDSGASEWNYSYVSPRVEEILGYTPEEWISDPHHYDRILHPDDREAVMQADTDSDISGGTFHQEYRMLAKDGRTVWVYDEAVLVHDENGEPRYWHGVILDISAQKEAEQKSQEREAEFRLLFSQNPHATWVFDRQTLRFLEVNDAAVKTYGYERAEFFGLRVTDLLPGDGWAFPSDAIAGEDIAHLLKSAQQHRLRDGTLIDVEITSHPLSFLGRSAMLVITHDVTERYQMERQLTHQAFHDALTGLPNRALFRDRLSHALDRRLSVAVLFVDLDDFKRINDTLGHIAGDNLLLNVGERLSRSIRPGDTIARLGGDEFTILLEDCSPTDAETIAMRLAESLHEPFTIEGHELVLSPSIGIAIGDRAPMRTDELLRRADVAMYDAKHRGKARFSFFSPEMDESSWARLELEAQLRRAITLDQFEVHYQPILSLETNEIAEVEALLRWNHPERGLVSPNDFIPLAEDTGLIVPIGQWVLEQACTAIARMSDSGETRPISVAVNLSARQFIHARLVEDVARALDESGLEPHRLKLEITETVAMIDIANTSRTLRALSGLGVRLAIDDFGAGYSGLSYLLRAPIDTLKIDRSYVTSIASDHDDRNKVRAVLAFANTLGLTVIAEGVETDEQLQQLRLLGVERCQGFLFSRPIPLEDVPAVVNSARASLPALR